MVDEWRAGNGDDPTRTGFDTEEQELYMALSPEQREAFQRYHIAYHILTGPIDKPEHRQGLVCQLYAIRSKNYYFYLKLIDLTFSNHIGALTSLLLEI